MIRLTKNRTAREYDKRQIHQKEAQQETVGRRTGPLINGQSNDLVRDYRCKLKVAQEERAFRAVFEWGVPVAIILVSFAVIAIKLFTG